jgi:lipid A 3-O-deacylase
MHLKLHWMILVLPLIGFAPQTLSGNEIVWRSIGLRGGVYDGRNDENFKQYESFVTWSLPWIWHPHINWTIGTYFEANAGVLRADGESAFVGSIGPGLYFSGFKDKIDISMGINPTIISKHKFGDENLGGPINFTSHIGLNLNFARHFTIGYRLQHMSNGVIYKHNPGLNMHMIEVGYRF